MSPRIFTIASLALIAVAGTANAQAAKPKAAKKVEESQAALMREAKVTMAAATATAQKEVPTGKIQSSEIEREGGKLIYSFDIKVAGKAGIEEVNVDANTGAMLAHEHETPKAEKKEARDEAREKKAAAKKKPTT
ncbi:MAG: PepSY domain protein [Gemmatimonadetes bacterium]|nr:PepSY domain protein [Gemmatimonadota bacterium]